MPYCRQNTEEPRGGGWDLQVSMYPGFNGVMATMVSHLSVPHALAASISSSLALVPLRGFPFLRTGVCEGV